MTDPRQISKNLFQTADVMDYIHAHSRDAHPQLENIRQDCKQHPWSFMLSTKDQAAFLHTLAKVSGATRILEIGSYYGHSTLALASALPSNGRIISIEHNPKFAHKVIEHMKLAGLENRLELIVGEARIKLPELENAVEPGSFDLMFIDADKRHSQVYWEAAIRLVRPKGLIIFDNVLARGAVTSDDEQHRTHVDAVKIFNQTVLNDPRVYSFIASIADGMLVATKI
jgi:predicted O-methyltransferase YrrM